MYLPAHPLAPVLAKPAALWHSFPRSPLLRWPLTLLGCGCSSGVEHNLAKVGVEGSNPFARSRIFIDISRSRFPQPPSCPGIAVRRTALCAAVLRGTAYEDASVGVSPPFLFSFFRHCEPTGPARSGRPDDKLREAIQCGGAVASAGETVRRACRIAPSLRSSQ
jgi:hypothetical protein